MAINLSANVSSYAREMHHTHTRANDTTSHDHRIERALDYVGHDTATKSACVSETAREAGNACYARGQFDEALRLYGEAIHSAPSMTLALAKAHGNRAAVLAAIDEHRACVGDLDVAMLLVDGVCGDEQAIVRENLPLMTKLKARRSTAADKLASATAAPNSYPAPSLVGGASTATPSISAHVRIASLPGRGRGLIVTSPISMGDTLVIEDAAVAYNSIRGSVHFCHHCLHVLPLDWLPCTVCRHASVRYCTAACRSTADAYHALECGWMAPLLDDGDREAAAPKTSLAIRLLLCATPDEICQFQTADDVGTNYGASDGDHFGTDFKSIKSLVSHVLVDTSFKQVVQILDTRGYFDAWPGSLARPEMHAVFAKQAAALTGALQCNTVGMMSFELGTEALMREMSGCWPNGVHMCASLINHACQSNVIKLFDGRRCYVRALSDLAIGDELVHTYRPKFGQWTRKERREFTKFGYDFDCLCKACTSDAMLALETELTAFLCDKCQSVIHTEHSSGVLYCKTCATTLPYTMDIGDTLLSRVHTQLHSATTSAQPINVEQLQYSLASARSMLHAHNKHLTDMTMTVGKALSNRNPRESAHLFESAMRVLETYYRMGSSEYEDCLARACFAHLRSLHDKSHARALCARWIRLCTHIYGHKIGRMTVRLRFGEAGVKLFDSLYSSLIV